MKYKFKYGNEDRTGYIPSPFILGLCNVYRHFVPKIVLTAGPLSALLNMGKPFRFGNRRNRAEAYFFCLKLKLSSPSGLALTRHGHRYVLDTAA